MNAPFVFVAEPSSMICKSDLVVTISESLSSKESLLNEFARQAFFPEYFGINWDAFDECLRDLSWIDQRRLVIVHHGLPLSNAEKELKTYLEVLRDVSLDWKPEESHEIVIVFPAALRHRVEAQM